MVGVDFRAARAPERPLAGPRRTRRECVPGGSGAKERLNFLYATDGADARQ
jgi:hypothetical protein